MNLLFITNIPSPYRVEFFEQLGKKVNLTVLFERTTSKERDQSWECREFKNFKGIFCRGINYGVDHRFSFDPIYYLLSNKFDRIIITNNISATGFFEILFCKLFKIDFCIEGDGAFVKSRENKLKRIVKTFLISGASRYYSTCKNHDVYYCNYGAKKEHIFRYHFSSILEKDVVNNSITIEDKIKLRKELGCTEKYMIFSIGRNLYVKGMDLIAEMSRILPKEIGIYVAGITEIDGESNYRAKCVGYKNTSELRKYFMAADVFVFPTRGDVWGLVVNEALSCRTYVISTDKSNAALEMIDEPTNGMIVNSDSAKLLAEAIEKAIDYQKRNNKFPIDRVRLYTIETMVEEHCLV